MQTNLKIRLSAVKLYLLQKLCKFTSSLWYLISSEFVINACCKAISTYFILRIDTETFDKTVLIMKLIMFFEVANTLFVSVCKDTL
jgi:hypothetical protein